MKKLKTLFFTLILMLSFSGLIKAQIISQYIETDGGNNPKGIEIWNNTGTALDFSTNTLDILEGTNGKALSSKVTVTSGTLASGEVMVIGTTDLGTYLTNQGLTSVKFVDYGFTFNGNDALVVKYGGTETDVFGTPGTDPGSEWAGSGVSTKDQNIELQAGITTSSTGFTDPSTRFSTVSTTPSESGGKAGFGIAPPSGNPATKLAVLTINSGDKPTVGTGFEVTVQAQDASGNPANVSSDTDITLTKATGSGNLGGTLTGTISNGSNLVTISGVTYDQAESGISITASDDASGLSSGTSTTFEVLSAPTKLVIKDFPSTGLVNVAIASFTVEVQRADDSVDKNSTASIAITKVSETGNLIATSPVTAVNGVATFSDVTFDAAEDYTVKVTSGSLNEATSSNITVIFRDFIEDFSNSTATGSYRDGNFVGNNGITWSYIESRDENGDENGSGIDGKAIMLRRSSDNSKIASNSISGGIGDLSVNLYKGYTGGGNRQVELFVNGVSQGVSTAFDDFDMHMFTVKNINIGGDVVIEIRNITSKQIIVDDISWTKYDSGPYNLTVEGNEGWRMLSTPTSDKTYADLLGSIWTQGFTGSDYEGAKPSDVNVQVFNGTTQTFDPLSNITNPMNAGEGFITYIFSDDDYDGTPEGFPKTLSVSGDENTGTVTPTLNSGAEAWSLVGNPYASIIEWGLLNKTDLEGVVYVYDHSYGTPSGDDKKASNSAGSYRVWNGTAGSLTDGKIATFQGFWVQNVSTITTGPELIFTESAKSISGNKFYKQSTQNASFRMIAEMNGLSNDAYFSFTKEGEIGKDNYDGLKLSPLDHADHLSLGTEVDGELMDINNLSSDLKEEVEFPVEINFFKKIEEGYATEAGEVTLSLADLKNIPAKWGIVLNNYNTGETIDLRAQESYMFQIASKAKMVKEKTAFSVLSPVSVTREKSLGSSGLSITIQPEGVSVETEPKDQPEQFALEQNYPNPFNPSTRIQYSVQESGPVTLTVYNVMGQQVETLVSKAQSAGTYRVNWNAANMASGIYYYRLQAGNQITTRQMTLIK